MKTTMKKIFAAVMAMAMALSLSATAFAAETDTASLEVVINGVQMFYDDEIEVTSGMTVYSMVNEFEDDLGPVLWSPVQDYYDPTVTDYALTSMKGSATQGVNDIHDYPELPKGYDYSKISWIEGRPGYGLLKEEAGEYTYAYAGYAWTYKVNGTAPDVYYMNQYDVHAGDAVVLTYSYSVTVWTTDTPIKPITAPVA